MAVAAARLAIRQLAHRATKLAGALLGVTVAVVLIFTQMGFKGALYDSGVAIAQILNGEIILTAPAFRTMSSNPPWIARSLLYDAESVEGVVSAAPFYASTIQVANPSDGTFLTTWLYAFRPDQPVFTLPDINAAISTLRLPNTALLDRQSRYELGDLARSVSRSTPIDLVLPSPIANTQTVFTVASTFAVGPTITQDGNMITSDLNYYRFLKVPLDRVSIGILKIKPGADLTMVKAAVERRLGMHARVFSKTDFIDNEIDFYAYRTPIGFIFNVGLTVGIAVGIVFISQVLHSIIGDNQKEYAALRAIGYDRTFFISLVSFIALLISISTYIPSVAMTLIVYHVAASATKLPIALKPEYMGLVMAIVIAMGLIAGLLSTNKLKSADPVDLF